MEQGRHTAVVHSAVLLVKNGGRLRCEVVAMVQAAEPRHRNDPTIRACISGGSTSCRSLLVQSEMCPIVVVIVHVFSDKTLKMSFVEHDDMIEQVASAITHPAFGDAVLPRASEAGSLRFNAEALDGADYLLAEVRRPVEDQVSLG